MQDKKRLRLLTNLILISIILNVANSSFLTYDIAGNRTNSQLGDVIAALRLPIVFLGLLIFFGSSSSKSRSAFFRINRDIVLFALVPWISIIFAPDKINASFYTLWHTSIFILILYFFFMASKIYRPSEIIFHVARLLIYGNILVLPFLIFDIDKVFQGNELEMIYSNRTFYPYCLLTVIGSSLIILHFRKFLPFEVKKSFLLKFNSNFYYLLIAVCTLFILASGRRAPLLVEIGLILYFISFHWGRLPVARFLSVSISLLLLFAIILNAQSFIDKYKQDFASLNRLSLVRYDSEEGLVEADYTQSLAVRAELVTSYSKIVADYPVFGVGLYNGRIMHRQYYGSWILANFSTHNTYLGILVETGWVGFIIFLVILIRSGRYIIRANAFHRRLVLLLFIPALMINFNEFNSLGGQVFFWPTVLAVILPRILNEK